MPQIGLKGGYMWFQSDYRRIFLDMHISDSSEEYLSKLDPATIVRCLKEADATSIVVKAKSHVGLHYFNSQYGKMHETLRKRNLDYVGVMTRIAHENGLNVIVYFSQIYDNYAYETHKSWRIVYPLGIGSRFSLGKQKPRYGLVCPNNPEYRQYCKNILTELATNYCFEGVFLDMPFWPRPCYCHHCRKKYRKETGKSLPLIFNVHRKPWQEFIRARQRWIDEFIEHNTNAIKAVHPEISVEHNMAAIGLNWMQGNTEKNFEHSDYAGGDYYGGYLEQTFMCKYYNNMTKNKPFCYITSRCDNNLFYHSVSRTMEDLLVHNLNALVHNGAFSICDALNPDGTITARIYSTAIKECFQITKTLEKYVSGDIKSDVAIWYNTALKINKNFIETQFDIARILKEKNIAFDVVGSKNLGALAAQVLVIADVQEITEDEITALKVYLSKGGNLFLMGGLPSDTLQELAGVKIRGTSQSTYSYINPVNDLFHCFPEFDAASPYPVDSGALEADIVASDVTVLATLTYPYTLRSDKNFAAIHSDPPGRHTNIPAVTLRTLGESKIIWAAAPMASSKAHNCRDSLTRLIAIPLKSRQFTSNAPNFVEVVRWSRDDKTYVSLINQQTVSPIHSLCEIWVEVDGTFTNITEVSGQNVQFRTESTETGIKIWIQKLMIFSLFELA